MKRRRGAAGEEEGEKEKAAHAKDWWYSMGSSNGLYRFWFSFGQSHAPTSTG
jgi:hypothetical protein